MKVLQQQLATLFATSIAVLTQTISANELGYRDDSCVDPVMVLIQETVIARPIRISTMCEENQNITINSGLVIEIINAPSWIDIITTVFTTVTETLTYWHGKQQYGHSPTPYPKHIYMDIVLSILSYKLTLSTEHRVFTIPAITDRHLLGVRLPPSFCRSAWQAWPPRRCPRAIRPRLRICHHHQR